MVTGVRPDDEILFEVVSDLLSSIDRWLLTG